MTRNAVGFYWTLPVPWAGFTTLPAGIDDAAAVSMTIRYQRDAIRRHAKSEGFQLIHEEVFFEIEPDRGSDIITEPLAKVEKICREHDAVLSTPISTRPHKAPFALCSFYRRPCSTP